MTPAALLPTCGREEGGGYGVLTERPTFLS